jgi:hypothetical protein
MVCLRKFDFEGDYVFCSERKKSVGTGVNTGVIKVSRANTHFARELYWRALFRRARTRLQRKNPLGWVALGPELMGRVVARIKLIHCVMPPDSFCPIDWFDIGVLFSPDRTVNLSGSYAIHLWDSMWLRRGFDLDGQYDPNSLIEKLKQQYGVK